MTKKIMKSTAVGGISTLIIAFFHRLLDPNQCAAVLNEHTTIVAVIGGALTVVTLWMRSPSRSA